MYEDKSTSKTLGKPIEQVIQGVKLSSELDNCSKFMICLRSFMTLLSTHQEKFNDRRIYDLLRTGWTIAFRKKSLMLEAPTTWDFCLNLNHLFGINTTRIQVTDRAHLCDVIQKKISQNRPVFGILEGMPHNSTNNEIHFTHGADKHSGFIFYGFNKQNRNVLGLTEQMKVVGWMTEKEVWRRLHNGWLLDIEVPTQLKFPNNCKIREFLLQKIQLNLEPTPRLGVRAYRYMENFVSRKLRSKIYTTYSWNLTYGIEGLELLGRHLNQLDTGKPNREWIQLLSQRMLTYLEERSFFLEQLIVLSNHQAADAESEHILSIWGELQQAWKHAAKLAAKIYMSKSSQNIPELAKRINVLSILEMRTLLEFQTFLTNDTHLS